MNFTAFSLAQTKNIYTKNQRTMSRQSRSTERERKSEEPKRDVAVSNERYTRQNRNDSHNANRIGISQISGLDRYRLNDLYERSSI